MLASVRLDSKIRNRVSFEALARRYDYLMRTEVCVKTAPEAISCMRPPTLTPADDGSLNGKFEILKFSVAATILNLNAA